MPLYNKAPYVRKAVESVIGQTFADWELVVVDDGSTDGGGDVAASFADSRIRVVRQENAGAGTARNRGVALTSAPYLCFLDADDWWEPTFLEEMAGLTKRHPSAGIYGSGYYIAKNGRRRIAPIGVDSTFSEGEINYCRVYARTLCMPLTSISVCIPRETFKASGGFPQGIRLGEDFLLWIQIALRHKVVLLNRPLANYNQDVAPATRAIGRLHPPERHMLWHLPAPEHLEKDNKDYKHLVDSLRCYMLLPYLLNRHYRSAARNELAKVDWPAQPAKARRLYRTPIWLLHMRQCALAAGSRMKQLVKCN